MIKSCKRLEIMLVYYPMPIKNNIIVGIPEVIPRETP